MGVFEHPEHQWIDATDTRTRTSDNIKRVTAQLRPKRNKADHSKANTHVVSTRQRNSGTGSPVVSRATQRKPRAYKRYTVTSC